jgi:CheY-like chemotaxis protein
MLQPRLGARDGRARVDPSQLEQVLVNIALNSRDAMPGGGVMTVETSIVQVGPDAAPEGAQSGEYIKLSVVDTGTGMSPEVRQHMFEPFFTTKPPGQGTGLGLAMVFGAVRQNGGFINVDSELGRGTTISIFLPRVWDATDMHTPTPIPTPPAAGSARLLFVEDEDVTRRIIVRGLQRAGYTVVGCSCPEEALRAVRSQHFDLMITDLVMPGMNGQQLAQVLQKDHPHLQVLYTSGYPEELIAHHGVLDRGLSYLPKPYTFEQLQTKISASLARARRVASR